MALIAGYGLDKMKKNLAVFILFAICIEGILNQQHDFRIHGKENALLKLESDMNRFSERNDLILINSGEYPTPMYFAHRKGWIESNEKINDFSYLETLKNKGLKYVVILKNTFGTDMEINLPIVVENEDYRIYTLTDNTKSH